MHFQRNTNKEFRHFKNSDTVFELLEEMRKRLRMPYAKIIDNICAQIRAYFNREFKLSRNPTRFEAADSSVVRERLMVALSGGIDSTVVTYLATKAVGIERLLPITMPARSNDPSVELARLVRKDLGFNEPLLPYEVDITPIVDFHMKVMSGYCEQIELGISHKDQNREQKMRSGNMGSRVRIGILYDLQRAIRGRILGTGNRTEYCQGYSAKFGTPISYDFGVLDVLYKLDIYEVAKVLGVPNEIITSDPSTGYFEGQTHEGELGASLEEQDIVSYLLFEKNLSSNEISNRYGISKKFLETMQHRWDVSLHKRRLNKDQDKVHLTHTSHLAL